MTRSRLSPILVSLILILGGCARDADPPDSDEPAEVALEGECGTVFYAEICTWGNVEGSEVTEFGITVPVEAVENAPLDAEPVFPPVNLTRIPLPEEVQSSTGLDHVGINWEVQGHPPKSYMTPHFDFHFYALSGESIEAIDCSDTSKPDVIPSGYILPDFQMPDSDVTLVGMCVPQMGMHASPEEQENSDELFDATMMVGYYAQEPIFLEPMAARDLLLSRRPFDLDVPDVEGAEDWPSSFAAEYDEQAEAYRFTFSM